MKTLAEIEEMKVLQRLKEGDERAFEQIYQLFSPRIFGNIINLLKDKEVAEDLLQEVFIKVWKHREAIDLEKSYKSYLFTIANRLVYSYFRRATLENQVAAYIAAQSFEIYKHIEENIHYDEINSSIQKAINNLPPKRKKVYILCKIDGKSYKEAADELGCSVAAINAHIVKATQSIKEQLGLTEPLILAAVSTILLGNL